MTPMRADRRLTLTIGSLVTGGFLLRDPAQVAVGFLTSIFSQSVVVATLVIPPDRCPSYHLRYDERRENRPVADFKLLIDVMEVLFDSAVRNIQPAPNFLVRVWRSRVCSCRAGQ